MTRQQFWIYVTLFTIFTVGLKIWWLVPPH
jgi:hypothetical protein